MTMDTANTPTDKLLVRISPRSPVSRVRFMPDSTGFDARGAVSSAAPHPFPCKFIFEAKQGWYILPVQAANVCAGVTFEGSPVFGVGVQADIVAAETEASRAEDNALTDAKTIAPTSRVGFAWHPTAW